MNRSRLTTAAAALAAAAFSITGLASAQPPACSDAGETECRRVMACEDVLRPCGFNLDGTVILCDELWCRPVEVCDTPRPCGGDSSLIDTEEFDGAIDRGVLDGFGLGRGGAAPVDPVPFF